MRDARDLFTATFADDILATAPVIVSLIASLALASRFVGPVAVAGLVLGVGLGGFVDGILFHQLLQWHAMFASVIPPTELVAAKYNMIWDGLFHVLTWLATLTGVVLLYRAGRRADSVWTKRRLFGSMLAGWGLFNLVEGTLDHLVLGIHHVRPGPTQLAWDLGFVLIGGVLLLAIGYLVARNNSREHELGIDPSSTSP